VAITDRLKPLEFRKMRKIALEMDNYSCVECGRQNCEERYYHNKSLSVHHIDGNYLNNNLSNLITLCYKCHKKQ